MRKVAGLTNRHVTNAKAPPGKRLRLSDWPASPVVLVISGPPSNHRAWTSRPRVAGRPQTFTHGSFPSVPLQVARERARAIERAIALGDVDLLRLRAIARGTDPDKAAPRAPDHLADVAAEFIARHLKARNRAPAYARAVEGRLANHVLPALGDRDIRSITRRDIITLLDQVADSAGPAAANAALAALRGLLHWANRRDLIETVPTTGILPPGEVTPRDRVLSDAELATVMRSARSLDFPFSPFVQLLILTGLRRGEVAGLRWDEVDLDERLVTLPPERMKGRRAHVVPLAPAVLDLLAHCPRSEPYVLSVNGLRPLGAFSLCKRKLDRHAPGLPWRLHDLRRSAATGMARLGVARFIVARVLAHADSEVTGVYDRYEYLAEKRAALERWATHVTGLLHPRPVEAGRSR